jgi:DNA-binding transcriptional regulator YiaG
MIAELARPLAEFLKRDQKLQESWERGQFLRNLKALASVVETVTEAAKKLGLSSGSELRDLLDSDSEISDLWSQTRLDTKIKAREALLEAAKAGNQAAIRVVENYLKDDQKVPAGPDLHHLSQKLLAELFDIDRLTVRNWELRDKLPRNADGSYDLYVTVKWHKDYMARKSSLTAPAADTMRDMKTEQLRLDLEERKANLIARNDVIAGLVARVQAMVAALENKKRELASMCHGQTIEGIEDIIGRFFEELQRNQSEIPEFLEIPPEAEKKLQQCLEILSAA